MKITLTAKRSDNIPDIFTALGGEFLGTFVMAFFVVGSVQAVIFTNAQIGLWQVAVVYEGFPLSRVVPYWFHSFWAREISQFQDHAVTGLQYTFSPRL